jgi:hypothetical protein
LKERVEKNSCQMQKQQRDGANHIANVEHNAWALSVLRENAVKAAEAATALQRPHEATLLQRVTQRLQGQEVTLSNVLRELGGDDSAAAVLLRAIVGPEDWARLEREEDGAPSAAASKRPRTSPEHEPTESDGDDDDNDDDDP